MAAPKVLHTKALVAPSSGPEDKVYGVDYVSATSHSITGLGFAGGRLTLTTGLPVTTADVTGATSIFYTPYVSDLISLWDGALWQTVAFTEYTLALGTLTSGKPYDVFAFLTAGALTLEVLVWTSDSARATAVTYQDGRLCKSGDKTRLLLGTFYTTATTTTEDSDAKRYLWNCYNQVRRRAHKTDAATSHTYGTATFREWNGGTGGPHRVKFVTGDVQFFAVEGWVELKGDGTRTGYVTFDQGTIDGAGFCQCGSQASVFAMFGMSGAYKSALGLNDLIVSEYASGATCTYDYYRLSALVMG